MRRLKSVWFAVGRCLCNTPALAWHEAGHMITALIAYEKLDPATREQLVTILKQHPRFKVNLG